MADLKRIDIKLYIANPDAVVWEDYLRIFTEWRDENRAEWLDIADYFHVPAGPGALLVGKTCHISVDNRHNRPGILYSLRGTVSGSTQERIAESLRKTLEYTNKLQQHDNCPLTVNTDEIDFIVNDRMNFPNDAASYNAIKSDLAAAIEDVFGKGATFTQNSSPTERLTVHIKRSDNRSPAQVLEDASVTV
ncbi:MAG: hypothetical protein O3A46_01285 [Candidatus Poribacteria bacterium]|nr:hypothetical protein [Candidatus Poribacteria bacterium]